MSFETDPTIFGFIEKSEGVLTQIITELLNPDINFTQTTDTKICERCDFKGICGR